jgi:fluoroacetyl-CoA thioesterase
VETPAAGSSATLSFDVTEDDTASALGSGDVPALATPRLLAWCEAATCAAVATQLDDGSTSVGTRVQLEHLSATPVGGHLGVTATL